MRQRKYQLKKGDTTTLHHVDFQHFSAIFLYLFELKKTFKISKKK